MIFWTLSKPCNWSCVKDGGWSVAQRSVSSDSSQKKAAWMLNERLVADNRIAWA